MKNISYRPSDHYYLCYTNYRVIMEHPAPHHRLYYNTQSEHDNTKVCLRIIFEVSFFFIWKFRHFYIFDIQTTPSTHNCNRVWIQTDMTKY